MKEDDLLQALSEVAREENTASPREEKLAALSLGTLDPSELEELEREAENDEELARELAAHRPLGISERGQIADRVLSLAQPKSAPRVIPGPARWFTPTRVGMALAGFAAAAAIVLVMNSAPEPLPGYELALSGGVQELRGANDPAGAIVLAPSSKLSIVLRPGTRVEGAVVAHAFELVDGAPRSIAVEAQVSSEGAVRIEAAPAALFGEGRGQRRLLLVVGRAKTVDSKERAAELAGRGPHQGPGYQVLAVDVTVTP
jgi:hypothetical protein